MKHLLQSESMTVPIWDHQSDFSKISSFLMSFEIMYSTKSHQLEISIAENFGTYEGYDRQRAGQFVWARGVHHLCGVLLHHPLALYRSRQACGRNFPPSFAREVLNRYQYHLNGMTETVKAVHSSGCCARGSFLGYLAACAAFLHAVSLHSTDEDTAGRAKVSLDACTGFLEQSPVCWPNHNTMVSTINVKVLGRSSVQALLARAFKFAMPNDVTDTQSRH